MWLNYKLYPNQPPQQGSQRSPPMKNVRIRKNLVETWATNFQETFGGGA
jgi:hypothetical protein